MINNELITELQKANIYSKATRVQKVIRNPKVIAIKGIEILCRLFEKTLKIKVKTFWNEQMHVIIPELVSLNIARYGFHEEGLTRMIFEYLRPGMTFIDIGAHFGYFTLLSSYIVGNTGQVHTFEPTPSTFSILKSNVSNKNNIVINNAAVFSKRKIVSINDYGIKYSAFNSIFDARVPIDFIKKMKFKKYEVDAISIDEYIEDNHIKPNFIKIDAESAEHEILLGMEKTINKFHPIISLEVGDIGVTGVPTSQSLLQMLIDRDYLPYEYKKGLIVQHVLKDAPYQCNNILFIPK
jgi:FkbM family methyltransferase